MLFQFVPLGLSLLVLSAGPTRTAPPMTTWNPEPTQGCPHNGPSSNLSRWSSTHPGTDPQPSWDAEPRIRAGR